MKVSIFLFSISTFFLGCGSSAFLSPLANVGQGEYLIVRNKATVYGQIQNQKNDVHLVISKKESRLKGRHIVGDSTGLFTIQLDSGTYQLYNDKYSPIKTYSTLDPKPEEYLKSSYNPHHEFTASKRTLVYIGSLFLTESNIEINFEKPHVDSLMKAKYPNFKIDRTTENYSDRANIGSTENQE